MSKIVVETGIEMPPQPVRAFGGSKYPWKEMTEVGMSFWVKDGKKKNMVSGCIANGKKMGCKFVPVQYKVGEDESYPEEAGVRVFRQPAQ